jgi:precorrin-6B methylase 2
MKKIIPESITNLPIIWSVRKIVLYLISIITALFRFKKISLIWDSFCFFPTWFNSVKRNNNPLNYDQPWIVYSAKRFLDAILQKDMTVWEYGSGSSTLYFARRVKQVYSVENDKSWFYRLKTVMEKENIDNVQYTLVEAEDADETAIDSTYISKSPEYNNKSFKSYVKSIEIVPDNSLDIVLVDGRARSACIAHAMQKIRRGGYLIVDNSERHYYFENNESLFSRNLWNQYHFTGPVPYTFDFSRTSFFKKRQTKE